MGSLRVQSTKGKHLFDLILDPNTCSPYPRTMETAIAPNQRPGPRPQIPRQTSPKRPDRKKRGLRKPAVRLALICLSIGVILGLLAPKIMASGPQDNTVPLTVYVVAKGDTLWSVARSAAPERDPRAFIDELRALNGIDAGHILPGQKLRLPSS